MTLKLVLNHSVESAVNSPSRQPSRRERILAAAELEFAGGFDGARVDRIAARAGVNKQLVFHYFGSKAGLYQAVATDVSERLGAATASGETTSRQLRSLVAALAAAAADQRGLLTPAWRQRALESAHEVLRSGQARGYIRDTVEPKVIAELVVSASVGWQASPEAAPGAAQAARESYCDLIVQVIADYCAWR